MRVQSRSVKSSDGLSGKYAFEDRADADALRDDILTKAFHPGTPSGNDELKAELTEGQIVEGINAQSILLSLDTGILPPEDEDVDVTDKTGTTKSTMSSTARRVPEKKGKDNKDIVHLFFSVLGLTSGAGDLSARERMRTLNDAKNAWALLGVRARKTGAEKAAERRRMMADKRGVVIGPPGVVPEPLDELEE